MQGLNARIAPNCNTRSPCIPIESHIGIITAFIAGMLRRFNPRSLALALLIVGTGCNAPHAQSRPSNTSSTSLVEASAPTFPRIDELLIKEWSANHIVSVSAQGIARYSGHASLTGGPAYLCRGFKAQQTCPAHRCPARRSPLSGLLVIVLGRYFIKIGHEAQHRGPGGF